ncbi:MAG: hypothetical protein LBN27_12090 [Prevotellaceae bacterium]|jgi:hypothetical protein|nr:hypothetical protein [Prevotellaceae bacterium]
MIEYINQILLWAFSGIGIRLIDIFDKKTDIKITKSKVIMPKDTSPEQMREIAKISKTLN